MVEDIVDFELSQKCHFCEKEFGSIEKKGNEDKVRDHCRRSLQGRRKRGGPGGPRPPPKIYKGGRDSFRPPQKSLNLLNLQ